MLHFYVQLAISEKRNSIFTSAQGNIPSHEKETTCKLKDTCFEGTHRREDQITKVGNGSLERGQFSRVDKQYVWRLSLLKLTGGLGVLQVNMVVSYISQRRRQLLYTRGRETVKVNVSKYSPCQNYC